MSYYVFGSSLSYEDYLQAKSFEKGIRGEIRSSTRALIATTDQLRRDNIRVGESVVLGLSTGFERVSADMAEVRQGISELKSTFEWGFSEMLTVMGGVANSLEELIRIAKNPAKNWAYEQFEDARDAYRKQLYREAIDYLHRAIDGYGVQTGYTLEYRFHYLLGTIRIGSFTNNASDIINLADARKAFLDAARYSTHDDPDEAAKAYFGAGWAAYCQGNMVDARAFCERAISLNAGLAEAQFQLAKVLMHMNEVDTALVPLKRAIQLDRGYTTKASIDGDFQSHQERIDIFFDVLRKEAKQVAETRILELEEEIRSLYKLRLEKYTMADPSALCDRIIGAARSEAATDTYYGYLDALSVCDSASPALKDAKNVLWRRHFQRKKELDAEEQSRVEQDLGVRVGVAEKRATTLAAMGTIALCLSAAGLGCFSLTSIVGVLLGIHVLKELQLIDDPRIRDRTIVLATARTRATLAIVFGAIFIVVWVGAFFLGILETSRLH
jgi:tetratricopeptide (TPR) repeat protein